MYSVKAFITNDKGIPFQSLKNFILLMVEYNIFWKVYKPNVQCND